MEEKRSFSRVPPDFNIIILHENKETRGNASSISLNGLFLKDIRFEYSSEVVIKIPLDELNSIETRAILRRVTSEGSGFEFLEILGNDSWYHLKNLVKYNIHDKHVFLKELDEHIGIKSNKKSD